MVQVVQPRFDGIGRGSADPTHPGVDLQMDPDALAVQSTGRDGDGGGDRPLVGVRVDEVALNEVDLITRLFPMEVGGIAIKPANVPLISCFDIVVEGTVIPPVGKQLTQGVGQFNLFPDFDHGVPLIGHAEGLIVDVFVQIPLLF